MLIILLFNKTMSHLLLSIVFSIGFLFESIFGFGGGIVSYSILAFFYDIKDLVVVAMYVGTISTLIILVTSLKHIKIKLIFSSIPFIMCGVAVGTLCFKYIPSGILIKIYSITLILISLRALLFKELSLPASASKAILTVGGFIQGVLGIGGPFFVVGLKSVISDKTILRANLAVLFLLANIYRYIQMVSSNIIEWNYFIKYWFIIIPVIFALWLGYLIHKKIPQHAFDKFIYAGILISAVGFLILF